LRVAVLHFSLQRRVDFIIVETLSKKKLLQLVFDLLQIAVDQFADFRLAPAPVDLAQLFD
jgi:hypothetical protein